MNETMIFHDRTLTCGSCGQPFTFSAGEQEFFHERGYVNDPKRCKRCKGKTFRGTQARFEAHATCAKCGVDTTVPFKPSQGRPVLCRACFKQQREGL